MDSVLSLPAPCAVGIKSSHKFYNGKELWIADLKPNRVLHGEHVTFYCLKKADRRGYPVVSTCNDGTLPIPECFVCEFLSVSLLLTNGTTSSHKLAYRAHVTHKSASKKC